MKILIHKFIFFPQIPKAAPTVETSPWYLPKVSKFFLFFFFSFACLNLRQYFLFIASALFNFYTLVNSMYLE